MVGRGTALAQPTPFTDVSPLPGELVALPPIGPTDLRFFGTYCLPAPKKLCKSVPVLPDPCVTLGGLRTHLDHMTTVDGGLIHGGGSLVLDGKQGFLAVSGSVLERGRMRFAGVVPGVGEQRGEATLSNDGLELTVSAQNRTLALRRDACGNRAPVVTLAAPFGPTFPFGQSVMLTGQIDDEDTEYPVERLVFGSNRQGLIPGTRTAGGRTLFTTALWPGNHHVTLTVTDSGGRTGQGSLDIAVVNRPPGAPWIFLPAPDATLVANASVLLQGTAFDPDTGMLTGSALAWSAQLTPGGPFVPLATGSELSTAFQTPADPALIRLTARDSAGEQSQTERAVKIVSNTGNAPPVVVIREPDRRVLNGPPAGGAYAGMPAHFVASAWDAEDAPPDLQLRWEFVALVGLGGAPDPAPAVPNPPPVTGTLVADTTFPAGPNLYYRVTFKATDTGGLSSSDSIEIWVTQDVIQ